MANIGVSSIFGNVIVNHDRTRFMTVGLSVQHSVRRFDAPFQVQSRIITGAKVGTASEGVPVGFLSNGDVIISTGFGRNVLECWTPGKVEANWRSGAIYHYPSMKSGSDVIVARTDTDSGTFWVHVEMDPLRQTLMFPAVGRIEILGNGEYVALKADSSIFLYSTTNHRLVRVIQLPAEMIGYNTYNEMGVDFSGSNAPYVMVKHPQRSVFKCFAAEEDGVLPDVIIPEEDCFRTSFWVDRNSDTVIRLCAKNFADRLGIITVYAKNDRKLVPIWSREVQVDVASVDLHAKWLGNKQFILSSSVGTVLFDCDSNEARPVALRYPANKLALTSEGDGILSSSVQSSSFLDLKGRSIRLSKVGVGSAVRAEGSDVVALLRSVNSVTNVLLWNVATDSEVMSVPLPFPEEDIKGARIKALSSDLQYAALSVKNDSVIVIDLNHIERSFIDECADCGQIAIDFSSNDDEMVVLGTTIGGVWDLSSKTRLFYDQLLKSVPFFTGKFGFRTSGDVLLSPTDKSLAIYDRDARSIRARRTFLNFVEHYNVIDDRTILAETRDSLFILDSSLATIRSIPVFPQHGSSPVSWNADKKMIALQLHESDILLLHYGVVSRVHDTEPKSESAVKRVCVGSIQVTVPTIDPSSIRIYDLSGVDVTASGFEFVTQNNETIVVSNTLSAGLYTIVDRSSGWTVTVMMMR